MLPAGAPAAAKIRASRFRCETMLSCSLPHCQRRLRFSTTGFFSAESLPRRATDARFPHGGENAHAHRGASLSQLFEISFLFLFNTQCFVFGQSASCDARPAARGPGRVHSSSKAICDAAGNSAARSRKIGDLHTANVDQRNRGNAKLRIIILKILNRFCGCGRSRLPAS